VIGELEVEVGDSDVAVRIVEHTVYGDDCEQYQNHMKNSLKKEDVFEL